MHPYQQITNQLYEYKNIFIKKKNTFDKNFIYPMDFWHVLMICWLIGFLLGTGVRIYYNGFIPVFTALAFEVSWWGLSWGKTPLIMRLLSIIGAYLLGYTTWLYVINVKRREHNDPVYSFMELNQLMFSDFKNYMNVKLYGNKPWTTLGKNRKD